MVEKLGIPTSSIVCRGFNWQASATAGGLGLRNLPLAAYPGPINLHTVDELQKNVAGTFADEVIRGLTVQPQETEHDSEPGPKDVVFRGSFEEVNRFFLEKQWSEGIPVTPPTVEKVSQFLKYTGHAAEEVIGVLLPDNRQATIWSVAVNGVMAGCRPEYMPVLVAIVQAMADPQFGQEHLGHTPGTEVQITVNGPIIKDLGFNYEQGALRDGFQANTSIGRFWRLYLRNVAGFLPHRTDKATFGGTWRVVLAENEDAVASIGWKPMSVDQGFQAGDNVITISSCISTDSVPSAGAANARVEAILDRLAARIVDVQLYLFAISTMGPSVRPQIILSPCVAEAFAKAGYSKEKVRQYFYEHATFSPRRYERLAIVHGTLADAVCAGKLPEQYSQSTDPDRLVPIVWSPEDFMITVSGDPGRDNCYICAQNGFIGYPVSKKIDLPANWSELLKEARRS